MLMANVFWAIINAIIGGIFGTFAGSPITIGNNVISAFIINFLGL
jgi:hypothetical protein